LFGASVWIAVCLAAAPCQEAASGADVKLTCLNSDETISTHASYPITWTAANIQANTVLSLRLQWTQPARTGASPQAAESSWLIGGVLDATSQQRFAALSRSAIGSSTIESGKYMWDVDTFCTENRQGNRSICEPGVRYRLQIILRSADDPCADNLHCAKPRAFFKVYRSDGAFAFRD
jgi:hypothetical protein